MYWAYQVSSMQSSSRCIDQTWLLIVFAKSLWLLLFLSPLRDNFLTRRFSFLDSTAFLKLSNNEKSPSSFSFCLHYSYSNAFCEIAEWHETRFFFAKLYWIHLRDFLRVTSQFTLWKVRKKIRKDKWTH